MQLVHWGGTVMTELDRLIVKLCPDGVPMVPLGEFAELVRGNGLQKKDFTEQGVRCIHYGQIYTYYGAFTYTTKSFVSPDLAITLKQVSPGDIIITNFACKFVNPCKKLPVNPNIFYR